MRARLTRRSEMGFTMKKIKFSKQKCERTLYARASIVVVVVDLCSSPRLWLMAVVIGDAMWWWSKTVGDEVVEVAADGSLTSPGLSPGSRLLETEA